MDQELYHYGVKGMKWGIRRKRSTSKSSRQKKSSRSNDIRSKIVNGKHQVDRFMNSRGGQLIKSAAIIGLASVGAPYITVQLLNYAVYGQTPFVGTSAMDAKYESMRGITMGPIKRADY